MQAISLFSGIGGLDIGFSAAGFDIIAQVEIDPFCQRILRRHAPEWWANSITFDDVKQFGINSLPGIKPGDIDVIFGGFPCQPHSVAGKQLGAKDDRDLWPEFRRIISEFRPRSILLENVPGILTRYAVGVIADLTKMGYDCKWGTIRASDTGAPHKRERWFCMANYNSQRQLQPERDVSIIRRRSTYGHRNVGNAEGTGLSGGECRPTKSDSQGRQTEESRIANRLNRSNSINRSRALTQSRMGRTTDGISAWLDRPQFPAGQGDFQYDYEAPRTIGKGIDKNRSSRIKALGNAVLPQIAYALACQTIQFLRSEYV